MEKILPEGLNIPQKRVSPKVIGLLVVNILLAFVTWWQMVEGFGDKPLAFWIWPILGMLFWVVSFTFLSLVSVRIYSYIAAVSAFVIYLIFFPKDAYVIAGGLSFVLLAIWFADRLLQEEKSRIDFSLRRILSSSLVIIVYAFLLLIGFNIYYNTAKSFKENPQEIYDRLGDAAVKTLGNSKYFSDNTNPNQTLDEYISRRVEKDNPNTPGLKPPNYLINQYKQELLARLGISAEGQETLGEIVARFSVEQMKDLGKRYERFFPLIFTLIILALLRTFAFVFHWLIIFVGWLIFKLLVAVRFFKLDKQMVEVEKLTV